MDALTLLWALQYVPVHQVLCDFCGGVVCRYERRQWEKQRDELRRTIATLTKELELTSQEPNRLRQALQCVQLASEKLIQAHDTDREALMKRLKLYRGF